jgi:hypothetical protein
MAWGVVGKLLPFIKAAGLDPRDLPERLDLSRFVKAIEARRKEAAARYCRV